MALRNRFANTTEMAILCKLVSEKPHDMGTEMSGVVPIPSYDVDTLRFILSFCATMPANHTVRGICYKTCPARNPKN